MTEKSKNIIFILTIIMAVILAVLSIRVTDSGIKVINSNFFLAIPLVFITNNTIDKFDQAKKEKKKIAIFHALLILFLIVLIISAFF